jgi:hypothetical protein
VKFSGSSTPRFLGAAAVIVVAGALGFFAYRAKQPAAVMTPAPAAAPPTVVPAKEEEPKKAAIPDTLPDITLADRDVWRPTAHAEFLGDLVRTLPTRDSAAQ